MAYTKRKGMNPALAEITRRHEESMLIRSAYKANMLATMMVLHDKFGFGEKRLNRFIDEHRKLLELYENGRFDVKDIETVLFEECGLKVEI